MVVWVRLTLIILSVSALFYAAVLAQRLQLPQWTSRHRLLVITVASLVLVGAVAQWVVTDSIIDQSEENSSTSRTSPSAGEPSENSVTAGWGPARPTFTMDSPAEFATFNSITDNPNVGDERNFVRVRQEGDVLWNDKIAVTEGDRIQVRAYFENSCADNYGNVPSSWIKGARISIRWDRDPSWYAIHVVLSADNTRSVWDGACVQVSSKLQLEIDWNSSKLYTNNFPRGYPIDSEAHSEKGALMGVGPSAMDGVIMPGIQYSGFYLFTFDVVSAN